ncbi:hypothetical protein [Pontibacter sp. SGAir0037]|uniref:hypothetical protein n=1 Tax=Pontibacter sp. SGAir0037 TaxID=2571030 RepID=UPI0010CCE5D2|nr:hypothetical protein [Pontibacter sp. SGAir0037]QCR22605.1 hypothetical protein C1N53_09820 [Pontibacter sp. SGAir0037]
MKLDKIITLANKNVELQFLAMERSLRATGCQLPIWVIPFDDNKFDLPEGAVWWEIEPLLAWSKSHNMFSMCRKYQCFLTDNYQYVDSDIIFLRNPEEVLEPVDAFITSCTHWNNPDHTYNDETKAYFLSKSTTWQKNIFNAGQFACDRKLYTLETLKTTCEGTFRSTLIDKIQVYKDQVAINLLVSLTGVPIINLSLPPYNMQSTWAGDYKEEGFEEVYWGAGNVKPYIVHWAGVPTHRKLAINKYFLKQLTAEEALLWNSKTEAELRHDNAISINKIRGKLHRIRKALKHA